MSSLIQNLSGLAPQGYYEEELERIRNRRRNVGFGAEAESLPALPDDGQDWRYDENNQPTLNPGGGDESYRNISIDYAPGTNVSPERYRQDQKTAEDRYNDIFGSPRDGGTSGDDGRQLPTPPPNTGRAGYGGRIGADPDSMFTMDFKDQDGDGTDDRHQRGPGQPFITWEDSTPEERGKFGRGGGEDRRDRREPPRWRGDDQFGPDYGTLPVVPFPEPETGPRPPRPEPRPIPEPGSRPPRPEPRPRPVRPDPSPSPDPGPRPPRFIDDGDGFPGFDPSPGLPIGGNPTQDAIEQFYRTELGRDAEREGMDYWMGRAKDGMSLDDIEKSIQQSDEAIKNRISRGEIDPPQYELFGGETLDEYGGQPHAAGSGTRRESSIEPAVTYRGGRTPSREEHESNLQKLRDTEDDWRGPLERYGRRRNEVEDTLQTSAPQMPEGEKRAAKKRAEVQRERSAERAARESVGRARRESITRPQPRTAPAPAPSRPTPEPKSDWLDQAYQSNLGRSADAGGKSYWANEVASGRQTKDQVIANIQRSDEYKNRNR